MLRLPSRELIGYVQATVRPDGHASIAYELASGHWWRGLAREAVEAMIAELGARYGVCRLSAALKARNLRSRRLLERLGFVPAPAGSPSRSGLEPDELLMQDTITSEEQAKWARKFAGECNNRAWRLAESAARSEAEDEEMLHCAHAAALHWSQVGTELHNARATMLLGPSARRPGRPTTRARRSTAS